MQVATAEGSFDGAGFDIRRLIDRAAQDVRSGRLAEAEAAYARIVVERPDYPDAWFLFGLTALESGDQAAAIERLQRAAKMQRAEPRYRVALARALLGADRIDDAVHELEAAFLLSPDAPDVCADLGRAYLLAGKRQQAATLSKRAVGAGLRQTSQRYGHALTRLLAPLRATTAMPSRRSVPWPASQHYEYARIAEKYRNSALTDRHYQQAAELAPGWAAPLVQLGRIAFDAEQFLASRDYLESACEREPDNIDALAAYGRTLSRMTYHEEAAEILERALRLAPDSPMVRCQIAWARYRASDTLAALDAFATLLDSEPRHIDGHFGTARCHADLGDTAGAIDWLHRTLALQPDHAGAYRELANLKALGDDDARLAALERLAQAAEPNIRRRSVLNMALGEVYRSRDDTERAFRHYRAGNAMKNVVFDSVTYGRYTDRVMQQFDTAHFQRIAGCGDPSEVPVFIVGMPRSGTSLIEQILASHPAAHGAGEREDIGRLADTLGDIIGDDASYPECIARLTADDIDTLAAELLGKLTATAPGAARIADKMPGNFLHLGLIATLYPNARVIHCRRDPLDVCLSVYFGEFAGHHPYAYDLENLGFYFREYERIMAFWSETLPLRIFDIRYEDVVEDVEGMTRRLLEFCDLPWDARCLDFHNTQRTVHTRSNIQVRQPIYRSSRGRWRPYARFLAPLADALGGEQPERLRTALES